MKSPSLLLHAAALAMAAVPAFGFAASDNFLNGQSIYGQPAAASSASRVIDLAPGDRAHIVYGETVLFRDESGRQFAWTFNGLDRRGVDLAKIAPAGFSTKSAVAYIDRDPANRR